MTIDELSKQLWEHDIWERGQATKVHKIIDEHVLRLAQVETAIIQINHFTEAIEKMGLSEWKGNVKGQLKWITILVGATTVAAIGQLVLAALRVP